MKKLVLWALKVMAKSRLKRFKGKIVAITGSFGKTSTKEAIYTVLNSRYKVRKNKGNMNSDFGMLLTILDVPGGNSAMAWGAILLRAFWNTLFRDHSEILLLEMGVDKPGDMDFLVSLVRPDVAVITGAATVHMAEGQFKSVDEIFHEKAKLAGAVKEGGVVILNSDDKRCAALAGRLRGENAGGAGDAGSGENSPRGGVRVLTYGHNDADYVAGRVRMSLEGIGFAVTAGGGERDGERSRGDGRSVDGGHEEARSGGDDVKKFKIQSPVLGKHQAYVILPAVVCGDIFEMREEEIGEALGRYVLPPGRLSVIEGEGGVTILDASYNASPKTMMACLEVLKELGEGADADGKRANRRRVAVLGNMNELGARSGRLHKKVGEVVPGCCDLLLTVGGKAKLFGEAMEVGRVFNFKTAGEAAEFYKKERKKADLVLVKGSQNKVRLEKFVKEIMLEPERAGELLVRQGKGWR